MIFHFREENQENFFFQRIAPFSVGRSSGGPSLKRYREQQNGIKQSSHGPLTISDRNEKSYILFPFLLLQIQG